MRKSAKQRRRVKNTIFDVVILVAVVALIVGFIKFGDVKAENEVDAYLESCVWVPIAVEDGEGENAAIVRTAKVPSALHWEALRQRIEEYNLQKQNIDIKKPKKGSEIYIPIPNN